MQRLLLLLLLMTFSLSMLAQETANQAQQSNTAAEVAQPQGENSTPVVSAQPPLVQRLTTPPVITYAATAPAPAGATNATPGNRAGATSATLNPDAVFAMNGSPNTNTAGSMIDFGPSGLGSSSAMDNGQSLAQAAANARVHAAKDHPRLYTNNDIARLHNEQNGFGNQNANTSPVTNQSTMPGSDVQANPVQGSAAQNNNASQPQATQPSQTPPAQAAPAPAQNQQQVPSPFAPKQQQSQPQQTQPPKQ
jgi:hypothetical protein